MPSNPGIYLFLDEKGKVLYVGKAKNLRQRASSYFTNRKDLGEKTKLLVSKVKKIKHVISHSEIEALLLEASYIKKFQPQYNMRLTDGKAYPLIKISIKDEYPYVTTSRKTDDPASIYFGPYPNAGAMKLVLKTVRKIFPFQSVRNHPKKVCLYNHLDLCPCPPVFNDLNFKKSYKKNIKHLINFLDGKSKKVLADLKKDRDMNTKKENFEISAQIQKRIDSVEIITNPSYKLFEYDTNPNLKTDRNSNKLNDLREQLKNSSSAVVSLSRIECFDISNIQGKNPVGSMVVFTHGEKNTSLYRKFKIRFTKDEPNDFAMMEEVLVRRFNHPEWPFPDLIIVDGGKGQVSSALKIIKALNLSIPIIGLAKREETIVTSDLSEIHLPKSSNALLLLMSIRDEAHRFAITYHRSLRSKGFIGS